MFAAVVTTNHARRSGGESLKGCVRLVLLLVLGIGSASRIGAPKEECASILTDNGQPDLPDSGRECTCLSVGDRERIQDVQDSSAASCKSLDSIRTTCLTLLWVKAMSHPPCQLSARQICLFYPLFPPFPVNRAQREHALPFHSLKRPMTYHPARANVAGHDLSLLYNVSDPIAGSFHSRDPFSAVARPSSEPPQPQPQNSTTRGEKPVCAANHPPIHHPPSRIL